MPDWYIPPLRTLFPEVMWGGPPPHVYLTFDDGPHPSATPAVLEALQAERVQASFFLVGEKAEEQPDIVRRIGAEGHSVGNHSYRHRALWFHRSSYVLDSLERTQRAISQAAGCSPTLFRPPYGWFDPLTIRYAARAGLRTVIWGVNTWDFRRGPLDRMIERVTRRTRPGDILLLHDGDRTAPTAAEVTRAVIRRLRDHGFTFAPLSSNV